MKTKLAYLILGTLFALITKTFFSWGDTLFVFLLVAVTLFVINITYRSLEDRREILKAVRERSECREVHGVTNKAEKVIINSKRKE